MSSDIGVVTALITNVHCILIGATTSVLSLPPGRHSQPGVLPARESSAGEPADGPAASPHGGLAPVRQAADATTEKKQGNTRCISVGIRLTIILNCLFCVHYINIFYFISLMPPYCDNLQTNFQVPQFGTLLCEIFTISGSSLTKLFALFLTLLPGCCSCTPVRCTTKLGWRPRWLDAMMM